MREQGSGTRQLFEDYIAKHQIYVRTVWEANSPRTLLNAVLYDAGTFCYVASPYDT